MSHLLHHPLHHPHHQVTLLNQEKRMPNRKRNLLLNVKQDPNPLEAVQTVQIQVHHPHLLPHHRIHKQIQPKRNENEMTNSHQMKTLLLEVRKPKRHILNTSKRLERRNLRRRKRNYCWWVWRLDLVDLCWAIVWQRLLQVKSLLRNDCCLMSIGS